MSLPFLENNDSTQDMKPLFYALLLLVFCLPAQAQQLVPLQANPALEQYHQQRGIVLPKGYSPAVQSRGRECRLENESFTYVDAGGMLEFFINIDTFGLDSIPGTYTCANCEDNPIGETSISEEDLTFTIIADSDLLAAEYRFTVEFCNPNGCRSQSFSVAARRASQDYFLDPIIVQAEEVVEVSAGPSLLPGPLACNKFLDLPDEYEGRDKRIYFSSYAGLDTTLVYVSSRHAGRDEVVVTLCDSFAVCDNYHYTFVIQSDTLKIGGDGLGTFLDDFSYEGPMASPTYWLDQDVFVNQTFAVDHPSLGVATFDGIDRFGQPYRSEGFNDRLTSRYLDLTDLPGQAYLTFWLQPRGITQQSPQPDDIMRLEFKDAEGEWQIMRDFAVDEMNLDTTPAGFFFPMLIDNSFKHRAFQFRFTAYNSGNGIDDIWNLDYVWLGNDVVIAESQITDVALTRPPAALIEPYSSMPWRHFKGREEALLRSDYATYMFNLDNEQALNAGAGQLNIQELTTGAQISAASLLNACCRTVPANAPVSYLQDFTGFASIVQAFSSDDFDQRERLEFELSYNLTDVTNEQGGSGYEAVARNNQADRITVFDDYFAYDDGTAETGMTIRERNQIAVKYTTAVQDTLQALQFHFPSFISDVSTQEFHLQVWVGELSDEPDIRMTFQRPFYPAVVYDSLQAFTTYPLFDDNGNPDRIVIPPGDFYVGWEQASPCNHTDCIPVGYDLNSPLGFGALFFNPNREGWRPFPAGLVPGALMLRPVMGSERPSPTSTRSESAPPFGFKLYPNPAKEVVNIALSPTAPRDMRMSLYNTLGQTVYEGPAEPQLSLAGLEPGLYVLELLDVVTQQRSQQRLIVAR